MSKLHQKSPNVTGLVTEWPKCKGSSQRQHDNKCKTANHHRLHHAHHFGAFGGSTRARFNVKTDELPRARSTEHAGRIWPVGQTLESQTFSSTTWTVRQRLWSHPTCWRYINKIIIIDLLLLFADPCPRVTGRQLPPRPYQIWLDLRNQIWPDTELGRTYFRIIEQSTWWN